MKHHRHVFGTPYTSKPGVADGHPGVRKAGIPQNSEAAAGPPGHWRDHYARTRGTAVHEARNGTAEDAMPGKEKQGGR